MNALFVLLIAIAIMLIASTALYVITIARRCLKRRAERIFSSASCSEQIEQRKWHKHEPVIVWISNYPVQPKLGWPGYKGECYARRSCN